MAELSRKRYDFEFIGGKHNSYAFLTEWDLVYEIRFSNTPYLFPSDRVYADLVFEFSIVLLESHVGKDHGKDSLVSSTVAAIIEDFYTQRDDRILLYICDSSDGRQLVRNRKFNTWFELFNATDYLKVDKTLKDPEGKRFPVSLILKTHHPFLVDVIRDFSDLMDGYDKD